MHAFRMLNPGPSRSWKKHTEGQGYRWMDERRLAAPYLALHRPADVCWNGYVNEWLRILIPPQHHIAACALSA